MVVCDSPIVGGGLRLGEHHCNHCTGCLADVIVSVSLFFCFLLSKERDRDRKKFCVENRNNIVGCAVFCFYFK